jgi:hypothetical protein
VATKGMSESTEILINYPNSYETAFDKSIIDPGKKSEYNVKIKGYPEVFSSKFLISGIKIPNFTQYAADLIEYPYGCLEQTTSAGFSQLYLDKIIALDPAQNKETYRKFENHFGQNCQIPTILRQVQLLGWELLPLLVRYLCWKLSRRNEETQPTS